MSTPSVSIGVPVRNGEDYLRVALDSLLAQDHGDFELIIRDNASQDSTPRICEEYARRDPRIVLHRGDTMVGAAENFNRVFGAARGSYFMWAAHDDRWHASYVSRCLKGLEEHKDAVLCASSVRFVDRDGVELAESSPLRKAIGDYNRLQTRSMDLHQRVRELTRKNNWYAFYGLIRADALRRTNLFADAYGGDVLLLIELLFQGQFVILDERLFDYRVVEKTPAKQLEDIRGTAAAPKKLKPCTELAKGLLAKIDGSPFGPEVKARLRDDLLENVSHANRGWATEIQIENAGIDARNPHLASVQIRDLLEGRGARSPRELHELAFRKSLSGMSASHRARRHVQHWLDRHVLWRLGPKA